MTSKRIFVTGIVQGVGFRPFIYGLAARFALTGWVRNTSAGVEIVAQGDDAALDAFAQAISAEKPPLAHIDSVRVEAHAAPPFARFEILESEPIPGAFQPISPDMAICPDCERELFDPANRRYLYPFINCTNCGPRFTIIKDLPYDRPLTTMAGFPLCADCRAEYDNPSDRRFHAQPVACPDCGPVVWLVTNDQRTTLTLNTAAILEARRLLRQGKIVAIKGLGGFHLACDAVNPQAVDELRRRKGRVGKPFALMAANMAIIERYCEVSEHERALLTGREKPIVLLRRRELAPVAAGVAPGMDTLGMMLPYTPLHHLLLNNTDPVLVAEPAPSLLVMTSGNFSEEPIAISNEEALARLAPLSDAFLLHNRDIHIRADDSVVRVDARPGPVSAPARPRLAPPTVYLRRSRGYAPYPVSLPFESRHILAVGGELKNTFCLTRERYAFLSQHIGDMENAEVYASFEHSVEHLARLFRIEPEVIAHDLHPGYFTTRYAERPGFNVPRVGVQHHHAHIAAAMADNGLENRKVIGLSFDGTGYGTDGHIWGGEVLVADYTGFERAAHLEYLPLPGADAAVRNPWRIAVGYAAALGLCVDELPFARVQDKKAMEIVKTQVEKGINAPLTSSMGRLFDAVASLAGVRTEVTYEAQAAIELEVLSRAHLTGASPYPFAIEEEQGALVIRLRDTLAAIIRDAVFCEAPGRIGAYFHVAAAHMAVQTALTVRDRTGLNDVVLSGGVWQNQILLDLTRSLLRAEEFEVYTHRQTPANDGGLALGQAAIAAHHMQE
ncbi:MAG: carbamoyltransferase HypF [Anaerolineales bacterium]